MNYELMVIIKPLLPEEIKSSVISSIEKLISKFEGSVLSSDIWGKRHLAYPINKHEEGYYIIYQVEMAPKASKEFDRELGLVNGVMRFLKVKKENV